MVGKRERYPFLQPLERDRRGDTTERVARVLKNAIVALDFAPGEFIDKALVCERLGVSRFPVSEAFGRLAEEGLVEILPQRGTRAARIRLAEVREAMLIRRALEAMVAEMAASNLPRTAIAELRANLADQQVAVDHDNQPAFHVHDLAFHQILFDRLALARVAAVVEASRANVDRVRRLLSSPRRHAVTLEEHRAIVAAIESGDAAQARQAMIAHLDAVMDELHRFSGSHPEVFAEAGAGGFRERVA